MDVEHMRAAIQTVYPYPKWTERVKWMRPEQVIAIYHKFEADGKFDQPKNKKKKVLKEIGIQISIWDILKGENK